MKTKQLYCIQIGSKIVSAIVMSSPMQEYDVETGKYNTLPVSEAVLDWPRSPALTFESKAEALKTANEIHEDARVITKSVYI